MLKQFIFNQIFLKPVISKHRLEMISALNVSATPPSRVTESLQKSFKSGSSMSMKESFLIRDSV